MAKTKSGRTRVRLEPRTITKDHVKKLHKGLREARARAPKKPNGKTAALYKYRNLIDNPPEVIGPVVKTYGGQTSQHRDPLFVTDPPLRKRIIKLLRQGFIYTTVCNYVGVRINTFLAWLERGKAGYSRPYIKFYRSVCRAEAVGEMNILRKMRRHSSSDWRVSAWQLERIWPEKYGRVDRIKAETRSTISVTTDAKKSLGTKVIQDDVARELARRMIDGEAQLHFNSLPAPERADA
jgi:hypothetical protein